MFFLPKNLKSENNNPWFNILLHTQSIVCATVDSQCLEYLGYILCVHLESNQKVLTPYNVLLWPLSLAEREFRAKHCRI